MCSNLSTLAHKRRNQIQVIISESSAMALDEGNALIVNASVNISGTILCPFTFHHAYTRCTTPLLTENIVFTLYHIRVGFTTLHVAYTT